MPKKIWFWIALTWTIIIAVLCLVSFKKLPSIGVQNTDKYVHATLHFFFTIFWYQHLRKNTTLPMPRILGRTVAFSIIYGSLIEIAQGLFTTTRQADLKDVAANSAGAILAVLLLIFINRQKKVNLQE